MNLRLELLGSPIIQAGEELLSLPRRRVRALLYYLAAAGSPQARDRLVALIWPDLEESRARHALRSTLIDLLVERYLAGADRDQIDPILDACVAVYLQELDEDGQVDFKGKAKAFLRTCGFLSTILPFDSLEWEKLSIFLTFLVPKLPAPVEQDLSRGILEAIDMDSYRAEKQATMRIALADEDAEIEPIPTAGGGYLIIWRPWRKTWAEVGNQPDGPHGDAGFVEVADGRLIFARPGPRSPRRDPARARSPRHTKPGRLPGLPARGGGIPFLVQDGKLRYMRILLQQWLIGPAAWRRIAKSVASDCYTLFTHPSSLRNSPVLGCERESQVYAAVRSTQYAQIPPAYCDFA